MEFSRWLLVVLLETPNGNCFVCVSGGLHWSVLFLLLLYCMHTCPCCAFVVCAPILTSPVLCTCSCYTFVANFSLLHLSYMHILGCFPNLNLPTLLHWTIPQLLTFLRCYHALLFSSWPSCIVTLCYSLAFDPLALLCYAASQFLTLLHYDSSSPFYLLTLLLNSWPSYVVP